MFGNKKVLSGEEANKFLKAYSEANDSLEHRIKGLSYNIHKLNQLIEKLITKL